jgi:hypothetical protein
MFWHSVLGGLAVLVHWQVWVAVVVYVALQFAWIMGIGMLMGRESESGSRMATGCLTHLIGGSIFQVLLLGGVVLFLTPLMLGGDQAMPLEFFTAFAWPIVKSCFLALVISLAVAFIPIVGKLISNAPGVDTFIQGVVIFRVFSAGIIEPHLQRANLHVASLYPGFWASVGYLVLATVLVYACFFAFAALGVTLSRNRYSGDSAPSFFLGMVLIPILGILPLFMYANHVTLAIQQAIR